MRDETKRLRSLERGLFYFRNPANLSFAVYIEIVVFVTPLAQRILWLQWELLLSADLLPFPHSAASSPIAAGKRKQ